MVASGGAHDSAHVRRARLYNRKDVVYRTVTDQPETQIGIAWLADRTDTAIEEFIGIVRGRTARTSSRQPRCRNAGQKHGPQHQNSKTLPRTTAEPPAGNG